MSQENQSCLRFSLEESLWFRKGQEVAELVSISLDPDITIQENDQYVTIRGSLLLTGEYKSFADNNVSEGEASTQKYVERVEVAEEGNCEFSHRFPVDITIPNNRIQSIYDIDVLVDTFDYSLPERSCLKLTAELTISGLYDSSEQNTLEEDQGFEVLQRYEANNPSEEEENETVVPIQFQAEEPSVAQFARTYQEEPQEMLHRYQAPEEDEEEVLFESEARKQQEEEQEPVEAIPKFPTLSYQAMEETREVEYQQQSSGWPFQQGRSEGYPAQEVEDVVEDVIEESPADVVEEVVDEVEESSSSPEAPSKVTKIKKALSKQKTMTLTEFFARKDENTEQARLKMCIVQKDDTLDSLAERYDVSVPTLLRENNLELNQDVYEGQVLYIPIPVARK